MTNVSEKKHVGEVIRHNRRKLGITQAELAGKIEISRSYVTDIENGRYMPSVKTLSLIARELKIDLNFLHKMTEIQ